MTLEIKNPDNLDLDDFCAALIPAMQKYATDVQNQDAGLIESWNEYFRSNDLGWPVDESGNPVAPTVQYIINQWFGHMDWFSSNGAYYIIPDDKLRLNSSEITIDSLARMINYGVLGVAAYRYFDDTLDFVAEQLTDLYNQWAGIEDKEQS